MIACQDTTKHILMKEAGGVLREAFSLIFYSLRVGADLEDIDLEVGRYLAGKRAISGLRLVGFPYNMFASINYEVVQGYPNRIISEGDSISIDMSILYRGVYVDKALSVVMPSAEPVKYDLADAANDVLVKINPGVRVGLQLRELGSLIKKSVETCDSFRSCDYFHGHGIGDFMHEEPMVPNYDNMVEDPLREGQFITIEPVVYGRPFRRLFFDDKWTITSDELSAHSEDTIYVTKEGIEVLT